MRASSGPYIAEAIVRACKGKLLTGDPRTSFDAITTDSRDIRPGDLFVAVKGEQFDGNDFVCPALEAGARGSLVSRDVNRDIPLYLTNNVLIQVEDTLQALSDLASAHRLAYPTPLIAVTGSSGKTTVKEMIAAVLKRSRHPLISEANFNNVIGLPMTVLNLGERHDVAVVEAGINRIGEMGLLAAAAKPDVAVITTIGPVHLEGLSTIENVAREKFKLAERLNPGGTAVLPASEQLLTTLTRNFKHKVVTFGLSECLYRAENITHDALQSFRLVSPEGSVEIEIDAPGTHNVLNALAAAAACASIGISLDEIAKGLADFRPIKWRMEIIKLRDNRVLLRDCYNANPQSMKVALEALAINGRKKRTLAVLGDMLELGSQSENLHFQTGALAANLGVDRVIFIGAFGESFRKGFLSEASPAGSIDLFADKDSAWEAIRAALGAFDGILVKGSRGMKLEIIADRILEEN